MNDYNALEATVDCFKLKGSFRSGFAGSFKITPADYSYEESFMEAFESIKSAIEELHNSRVDCDISAVSPLDNLGSLPVKTLKPNELFDIHQYWTAKPSTDLGLGRGDRCVLHFEDPDTLPMACWRVLGFSDEGVHLIGSYPHEVFSYDMVKPNHIINSLEKSLLARGLTFQEFCTDLLTTAIEKYGYASLSYFKSTLHEVEMRLNNYDSDYEHLALDSFYSHIVAKEFLSYYDTPTVLIDMIFHLLTFKAAFNLENTPEGAKQIPFF